MEKALNYIVQLGFVLLIIEDLSGTTYLSDVYERK